VNVTAEVYAAVGRRWQWLVTRNIIGILVLYGVVYTIGLLCGS